MKPAYPLWLDVRPSGYPVFNTQREFGGKDGECTWPKEQCADVRPLRQAGSSARASPATARARTCELPAEGEPFGTIENVHRRHADRHRRPPAPGRHPERDRPRPRRQGATDLHRAAPPTGTAKDTTKAGGPPTRGTSRCAVIGPAVLGRPRQARRHAAPQRDLRHDAPVDLREHGHRGRAARARHAGRQADRARASTRSRRRSTARKTLQVGRPARRSAPTLCDQGLPSPTATCAENDNYGGPRGDVGRASPGVADERASRSPTSSTRPATCRRSSMTGIPTVKLGRDARLHQPRGRGDLPHGHLVQVPLPRPDRRGVPARRRRDEPAAASSTSTRRSSASARRRSGRPRTDAELGRSPVTQEEGYKPGEIVTYFCRIHPFMRGAFEVDRVIDWKRHGPSLTLAPARATRGPTMSEDLPVDVLPCSNDEYFPPPPTPRADRDHGAGQTQETERWRRKFNMSRARVRAHRGGDGDRLLGDRRGAAGRLRQLRLRPTTPRRPTPATSSGPARKGLETLRNLPGEFIFDVQSHHVDPDGMWRVDEPGDPRVLRRGLAAGPPRRRRRGRPDREPLALPLPEGAVPRLGDDAARCCRACRPRPTPSNPLPLAEAAQTVDTVNELARSQRSVMHAFVMPNRGGTGDSQQTVDPPLFLDEELQLMMERAEQYRDLLRGWKTYCAWGDVPNASGWFLDTDTGHGVPRAGRRRSARSTRRSRRSSPPTRASRCPASTSARAAPRDVGPAAKANPGVHFIVYHSGYDTGDDADGRTAATPRPTRAPTRSTRFIKSLRENNYDAPQLPQEGQDVRQRAERLRRARLGLARRDERPRPGRAPARQADHPRRPEADRAGAPTASGTARRSRRSSRCAASSSPTRARSSTACRTGSRATSRTRRARRPTRRARSATGSSAATSRRLQRRPGHEAARDQLRPGERAARRRVHAHARGQPPDGDQRPLASNLSPGARTRREVWKSITEGPWSP